DRLAAAQHDRPRRGGGGQGAGRVGGAAPGAHLPPVPPQHERGPPPDGPLEKPPAPREPPPPRGQPTPPHPPPPPHPPHPPHPPPRRTAPRPEGPARRG